MTVQSKPLSPALKARYLSDMALFQELSPREFSELNRITTLRRVRRGYIFYYPEDSSDMVYILMKGRVDLYRINLDGKKLIVSTLHPQAIFDETALFGSQTHQCFAEAAEECTIFAISTIALQQFMLRNAGVALQVLHHSGLRLQRLEQKMESLVFKDLTTRISELLLQLAQDQGGQTVTGFTHQDIAESLGTYRETATQILNGLKAQGHIHLSRKRIDILNPDVVGPDRLGGLGPVMNHSP